MKTASSSRIKPTPGSPGRPDLRRKHRPAAWVAGDIMSSPIITLDRDLPLGDAAVTLSEHQIGGALVVGTSGQPVGVASLFDIVTYLSGVELPPDSPGGFYRYSFPKFREGGEGWEKGWEVVEESALRETPVAEVMSTGIITVPHDLPVEEVARTLWKRHIHRVFVSRDGNVVGVITTMDVLRALTRGRRAAGN